jgi:hypothetical protein
MKIKGPGLGFGRILRGVWLSDRLGMLVGGRQIGSCGVGLGAMVARRARCAGFWACGVRAGGLPGSCRNGRRVRSFAVGASD